MRHLRFAGPILSVIAFCAGCNGPATRGSDPAPAAPAPAAGARSTPDAVRGTVRLRDGAAFPPGARLRVVARWHGTRIGEQVIDPVGAWPVAFAVPLDWPTGKGSYSHGLGVHATAEVDGRAVMVTHERIAAPPPEPNVVRHGLPAAGTPVELVLFPTIE